MSALANLDNKLTRIAGRMDAGLVADDDLEVIYKAAEIIRALRKQVLIYERQLKRLAAENKSLATENLAMMGKACND